MMEGSKNKPQITKQKRGEIWDDCETFDLKKMKLQSFRDDDDDDDDNDVSP
jgi:hypothetical protein